MSFQNRIKFPLLFWRFLDYKLLLNFYLLNEPMTAKKNISTLEKKEEFMFFKNFLIIISLTSNLPNIKFKNERNHPNPTSNLVILDGKRKENQIWMLHSPFSKEFSPRRKLPLKIYALQWTVRCIRFSEDFVFLLKNNFATHPFFSFHDFHLFAFLFRHVLYRWERKNRHIRFV